MSGNTASDRHTHEPRRRPIQVVLVDDDPLILEAHRLYLARVGGFHVLAECAGARAALQAILDPLQRPDLVLLDVTMPDGTGLDVLRHARARGSSSDVIAISGVRDADVVREMVALGAVQYLIKPYTFPAFRERLENYRDYFHRFQECAGPATQREVDALFATLRPATVAPPPKGLAADTLARVEARVRGRAVTASELAAELRLSREVSRRYLEYLVSSGSVDRFAKHGARGRPQAEYRWKPHAAR